MELSLSLTLYQHPLASFCHKVLIALYENGHDFEKVLVDLADPDSASDLLSLWPVGKMPVLHDAAAGRTIPETSIILEYLDRKHPGPVRLIPEDFDAAMEARLWDRFFDLYVSQPMQTIVIDRIRPESAKDPAGVANARATLDTAYRMIEARMADRDFIAGDAFSIAECSATPALFFAGIVHPFGADQNALKAYFYRIVYRAAAQRVLDEARPYFHMFPYREEIPDRFL